MLTADPSRELHYTPAQLATLWGLDRKVIARWFRDEPGVLRFAEGTKGVNETLRIPASVAERVHRARSGRAA